MSSARRPGAPRRCGWFDAAALKRSIQINGVSGLCVTKLDVLDGMEEVRLGIGYRCNGVQSDILPFGAEMLAECEPVYEELPGWSESTVGITRFEELPPSGAGLSQAHGSDLRRADRSDFDGRRSRCRRSCGDTRSSDSV